MDLGVIAPTPYFSDRGCHIRVNGMTSAAVYAGFSPHLYTYHIGRDMGKWPHHRIKGLKSYDYTGPGPRWKKIILDLQLKKLLKRDAARFDLIHAHLHEGGWIASSLNIPYVLDLQGMLVDELYDHGFVGSKGIRRTFWTHVEKSILKAKSIITSSHDLANRLDEVYGVEATPVEDGVDTAHFRPLTRNKALIKRYGLEGKNVLGYLGGLGPGKGIPGMLNAFAELDRENTVLLIGGYPWQDRVKALAQEMGLADKVILLGRVPYEDAPTIISLMDAAVAPKVDSGEGGQGKLLSYTACGVPTVAYDSRDNRRLLGGNAFYFRDDMAKAMESALGPKGKNKGRKAQAYVSSHHSWKIRSRKLKKIYDELTF